MIRCRKLVRREDGARHVWAFRECGRLALRYWYGPTAIAGMPVRPYRIRMCRGHRKAMVT